MRKFLLLFLLLVNSAFAIEWLEYDKALQLAQKQYKTIMVMLGRDSCHVCKYMKTVVFKDKSVLQKLDEKFLSVYIELDFDDIPNNLEYFGTPTFYFLDKEQKILERINGGKTVPAMMKTLLVY